MVPERAIPPGEYFMPRAESMNEMNSPEFQEKLAKYPGVMMTIWPGGRPSMGKSLTLWFLYSVVIGIFVAYVAGRALEPGESYLSVLRFAGVTAFACYAMAGWQETIWYKRSVSRSLKNTIDSLIYALLTGAHSAGSGRRTRCNNRDSFRDRSGRSASLYEHLSTNIR